MLASTTLRTEGQPFKEVIEGVTVYRIQRRSVTERGKLTYLAKLLLDKGYRVYGTSRDAQVCPFRNLERLQIRDQIQLESVALNDFRSVIQVLFKVEPDEIYNLAGQSSVSLSFEQPVETQESSATVFGNQALTVKPVTPLSPPRQLHQVRTDASVTIRLLISTPVQRVSLV